MIKPLIAALLIAIGLFFGMRTYFAKPEAIAAESQRKIIVGTESNYPPFEFIKDGTLSGFEIELLETIGKRLGLSIEFRDMAFDNLLFAASSGQIQLIAAALTPTPERARQVLFCEPYLQASKIIALSSAARPLTSLAELKGKTLLMTDGFTSGEEFIKGIEGAVVKKFPTITDGFLALKNGQADALVVSSTAAAPWLAATDAALFYSLVLPATEASAFAVSKLHPELVTIIDQALKAMKDDGSLVELLEKWHITKD